VSPKGGAVAASNREKQMNTNHEFSTETYRGLVLAFNHYTGRWSVRQDGRVVAYGLRTKQDAMRAADRALAA